MKIERFREGEDNLEGTSMKFSEMLNTFPEVDALFECQDCGYSDFIQVRLDPRYENQLIGPYVACPRCKGYKVKYRYLDGTPIKLTWE